MATCFKTQTLVLSRQSVTATGNNLYVNGLLFGSGIYSTINALAESGSNLYALVTGGSGQAAIDYATKIQLTNTGVIIEGQINSLSGWANNLIALTGQQAWTHGQNNALNLSGALQQSGQAIYQIITGQSGQNAIDFATKTQLTQTGATLNNKIDSLSGFVLASSGGLESRILQTGNAAVAHANGIGINLSGNLALSGSNLYLLTTGLSGSINALVIATGASVINHANGIGTIISGNLTTTGQTLYNLITNSSGQYNVNYAPALANYVYTTGNQTITGLKTWNSGIFYGNVLLTGGATLQFPATSATTQSISAAGNNILISPFFEALFSPANSAGRFRPSNNNTSELGAQNQRWIRLYIGTGDSSFSGRAGFGLDNPTEFVHSAAFIKAESGYLSGATNISDIFYPRSNPSGYVTGLDLYQTGSNLYNLVTGLSGSINTLVVATGNAAINHANSIGNVISGNLTVSGQTLYNLIINSSGQDRIDFAPALANYVYTTGNQQINGSKVFSSSIITSGANDINSNIRVMVSGSSVNPYRYQFYPTGAVFSFFSGQDAGGSSANIIFGQVQGGGQTTVLGAGESASLASQLSFWGAETLGLISDDNIGMIVRLQSGAQSGITGFWMTSEGNIGINLLNPSAKLHVNGTIRTDSGYFSGSTNIFDIYYPRTNPSGYITGFDLYQTGASLLQIIANTGQQAWLAANNNGINLSGGLNSLSGFAINISGYLQNQITDANADVSSINRQSGALLITGTGGLTIISGGPQLIIISGDQSISGALTSTGVSLGAKIDSLSGFINNVSGGLETRIFQTGNATIVYANGIGFILSGNLQTSGSNLYNILTGLSGQSVIDYATKIQLTQTGVFLGSKIDSLSGFVGLTSGGLENRIIETGNSVVLHSNGIGINLSGNLALSGSNLYILATGLSGSINSLIIATGVSVINHANGIGNIISGNLTITGQALYNLITNSSGQYNVNYAPALANYVYTTGIQTIGGTKTFLGQTIYSGNDTITPILIVKSGTSFNLLDYKLYPTGSTYTPITVYDTQFGPSMIIGAPGQTLALGAGESYLLAPQLSFWGQETLGLVSDDNIAMVVRLQSGAQSGITGFWMTNEGSIGINTVNPSTKLHVNGNIRTDSGFFSGSTNLADILYPRNTNPSGFVTSGYVDRAFDWDFYLKGGANDCQDGQGYQVVKDTRYTTTARGFRISIFSSGGNLKTFNTYDVYGDPNAWNTGATFITGNAATGDLVTFLSHDAIKNAPIGGEMQTLAESVGFWPLVSSGLVNGLAGIGTTERTPNAGLFVYGYRGYQWSTSQQSGNGAYLAGSYYKILNNLRRIDYSGTKRLYSTIFDQFSYASGNLLLDSGSFTAGLDGNFGRNLSFQSGLFSGTTNVANLFYPRTNPSGYVTGFDLYQTGSNLYNIITGLSGNFVSQIASTGQQAWNAANNNGINLSGQLNSLSGFTVNIVSGGLENRITATGNSAVTHSNGIGINLSGNLQLTGSNLQNQINVLSASTGNLLTNVVFTTGTQFISGTKYFIGNTFIDNLFVTGQQTVINTQDLYVADNWIVLNSTGGARDSALFVSTGFTGASATGGVLGFDVPSNTWRFGLASQQTDLINLPRIASGEAVDILDNKVNGLSGFVITIVSGGLENRIFQTGNSAILHANGIGTIISGNLTTTGQTLVNQINGLSGVVNQLYGNNIVYTTGDQNVGNIKSFNTGIFTGRVGIGNGTPVSSLHIGKTSSALITLESSGANNTAGFDFLRERQNGPASNGASIFLNSLPSTNNAYLFLQAQTAGQNAGNTGNLTDGNGVRLVFRGGEGVLSLDYGALGIGTTVPQQKLHVTGGIRTDFGYFSGNTNLFDIYYPRTNPSGYVTGYDLYQTGVSLYNLIVSLSGVLNQTGSVLDTKINTLSGYTDGFVVHRIGNESITGTKIFLNKIGIGTVNTTPLGNLDITNTVFDPVSNATGALTLRGNYGGGIVLADTANVGLWARNNGTELNIKVGYVNSFSGAVGDFTFANTHFGVGTNSPSHSITSTGAVRANAGYFSGTTNIADLLYPRSNPSGYVTGFSLYQTGSILDGKINSLSGYSESIFVHRSGDELISGVKTFTGAIGIGITPSTFKLDVSGNARVSSYLQAEDFAYPVDTGSAYLSYGTTNSSGPQSTLELIESLSNAIGVNDPLRFRTILSGEVYLSGVWTGDLTPPAYGNLLDGRATNVVDIVDQFEITSGISGKRFVLDLGSTFRRPNFITINNEWNQNYWGYKTTIERSNDTANWTGCCTEQTVTTNATRGTVAFSLGDQGISRYFRFSFLVNQPITTGSLRLSRIRSYGNQGSAASIPVYTNSGGQLIATNNVGFGITVPSQKLQVSGGNIDVRGGVFMSGGTDITQYYYPRSNPSGYVTGFSLYQTGSILDNKINSLSGTVLNLYGTNIVYTTGNQTITGFKTFNLQPNVESLTLQQITKGISFNISPDANFPSGRFYFIATLPPSDNNSRERLIVDLYGGGWGSSEKFHKHVSISNRNQFNYYWTYEGVPNIPDTSSSFNLQTAIRAYNTVSGTDVYLWAHSGGFQEIIYSAFGQYSGTVRATGIGSFYALGDVTTGSSATGLIFDTLNPAVYNPATAAQKSKFTIYSGVTVNGPFVSGSTNLADIFATKPELINSGSKITSLSGYVDTFAVHRTGAELISGNKTFANNIAVANAPLFENFNVSGNIFVPNNNGIRTLSKNGVLLSVLQLTTADNFQVGTISGSTQAFINAGGSYSFLTGDGNGVFGTLMRLGGNGRVSIGQDFTNPTEKFQISGGNIRVDNQTAASISLYSPVDNNYSTRLVNNYDSTIPTQLFTVSNKELFRGLGNGFGDMAILPAGGKLGIGTSGSYELVQISGGNLRVDGNIILTGNKGYFSGTTNLADIFATQTALTNTGALLSSVKVTGSSIINNVNITGIGGTNVFTSGGFVFISGSAGAVNSTAQIFSSGLASGSDSYYINFPNGFSTIPVVDTEIYCNNDTIYTKVLKDVSKTGFRVIFSNILTGNEVTIGIHAVESGSLFGSAGGGTGTINGAENLGNGSGLYLDTQLASLRFKSIQGTGGVSIIGNSSTLYISGSADIMVTGNYTVPNLRDMYLYCNNTLPITITFGDAIANEGQLVNIKLLNTGSVYLTGAFGQNFDGSSLYTIVGQYGARKVKGFNSNWYLW